MLDVQVQILSVDTGDFDAEASLAELFELVKSAVKFVVPKGVANKLLTKV